MDGVIRTTRYRGQIIKSIPDGHGQMSHNKYQSIRVFMHISKEFGELAIAAVCKTFIESWQKMQGQLTS